MIYRCCNTELKRIRIPFRSRYVRTKISRRPIISEMKSNVRLFKNRTHNGKELTQTKNRKRCGLLQTFGSNSRKSEKTRYQLVLVQILVVKQVSTIITILIKPKLLAAH